MPTGLTRRAGAQRERRPAEQLDVIRRVRERRKALGYSLALVAIDSGYYAKSMLGVLERSLSPGVRPRPRMSRRGLSSLVAWLDATEAAARLARKPGRGRGDGALP